MLGLPNQFLCLLIVKFKCEQQNNAQAKKNGINNVEKSIWNYFSKMIDKPHDTHMNNRNLTVLHSVPGTILLD